MYFRTRCRVSCLECLPGRAESAGSIAKFSPNNANPGAAWAPFELVEKSSQRFEKGRACLGNATTHDDHFRIQCIDQRSNCGGQSPHGIKPDLPRLPIPLAYRLNQVAGASKPIIGALQQRAIPDKVLQA